MAPKIDPVSGFSAAFRSPGKRKTRTVTELGLVAYGTFSWPLTRPIHLVLALVLSGCARQQVVTESAPRETPPAAPEEPEEAPTAPELGEVKGAVPVVLFAAIYDGEKTRLAPLACLDQAGNIATAEGCSEAVESGLFAQDAFGGDIPIGEAGEALCNVDESGAMAWETDPALGDGLALWPTEAGEYWHLTGERVAGPALRESIQTQSQQGVWGWELSPEETAGLRVTEVMRRDLDGIPGDEILVEAWVPSADPDKPGSGMVFWGSDTLEPLPTGELSLIGVSFVQGFMQTPGGGFLVLGSRWMGGMGSHVLWIGAHETAAVGEWSCGS
jgi:hypothetical protein